MGFSFSHNAAADVLTATSFACGYTWSGTTGWVGIVGSLSAAGGIVGTGECAQLVDGSGNAIGSPGQKVTALPSNDRIEAVDVLHADAVGVDGERRR
jgi:hypothetical protein